MTPSETESKSHPKGRPARSAHSGAGPFCGQYTAAKNRDGRLRLSKSLADVLKRHDCCKVYVAHSPTCPGIVLCPEQEWTEYATWLRTQYSKTEWPRARELFVCAATPTPVDRQGRIALPRALDETLGLKSGNCFMVLGTGRWFFAYTRDVVRSLYGSFYLESTPKTGPDRAAPEPPKSARGFPGMPT